MHWPQRFVCARLCMCIAYDLKRFRFVYHENGEQDASMCIAAKEDKHIFNLHLLCNEPE